LFTDAQVEKLKKKLQKLKNAGVDVPELNMEGYFDHGGYDIPFEEEEDVTITPFDQLRELYEYENEVSSRNPRFEEIKNFFDGHPELKQCNVKHHSEIIDQDLTVIDILSEFYDWRQLKDYLTNNHCKVDFDRFKVTLLYRRSELSPTNHKMTLATFLDHMVPNQLHLLQRQLQSGNIMFGANEHAVMPSLTFIMDVVNYSNISLYEKQKFKDILFPPVSGVKRTRAGKMYGGSKSRE
jgi:hypothetical protein